MFTTLSPRYQRSLFPPFIRLDRHSFSCKSLFGGFCASYGAAVPAADSATTGVIFVVILLLIVFGFVSWHFLPYFNGCGGWLSSIRIIKSVLTYPFANNQTHTTYAAPGPVSVAVGVNNNTTVGSDGKWGGDYTPMRLVWMCFWKSILYIVYLISFFLWNVVNLFQFFLFYIHFQWVSVVLLTTYFYHLQRLSS